MQMFELNLRGAKDNNNNNKESSVKNGSDRSVPVRKSTSTEKFPLKKGAK